MKTIFGLYQLAAEYYNENVRILREDPETLSSLEIALVQDLQQVLRIKMNTIEECNDALGGTFIRREDDLGYIVKLYSQNPHTGCAVEFDFDSFEFVPVPDDIHAH